MTEEIDVLLMDDDEDICSLMESILKFSGFRVRYCTAPANLAGMLGSFRPRIVFMDMFLSGADGRDICRKLKSDEATAAIKIVMMSAHPDGAVTCLHAGADDFMPKPFDIDQFTDKVRYFLKS